MMVSAKGNCVVMNGCCNSPFEEQNLAKLDSLLFLKVNTFVDMTRD